jgi:chromosome segregation ATPase
MFWTDLIFLPSYMSRSLHGTTYHTRHRACRPNSATKSLAAQKFELAEEKATQQKAQTEAETLTQAVGELEKMADGFAVQIHVLEDKVKYLDNKVLNGVAEISAKELGLEQTTKTNEDYKNQNTRLTKKMESNLPSPLSPRICILLNVSLTPL